MSKEYTISKLADILGISVQATTKKVNKLEKEGYRTTKIYQNNDWVKAIVLNNQELTEIMKNTKSNKRLNQNEPVYKQVERVDLNELNNDIQPEVENQIIEVDNDTLKGLPKLIADTLNEIKEDRKELKEVYKQMLSDKDFIIKKLQHDNEILSSQVAQLLKDKQNKGLFNWFKK